MEECSTWKANAVEKGKLEVDPGGLVLAEPSNTCSPGFIMEKESLTAALLWGNMLAFL